jgi:hypothetical protein
MRLFSGQLLISDIRIALSISTFIARNFHEKMIQLGSNSQIPRKVPYQMAAGYFVGHSIMGAGILHRKPWHSNQPEDLILTC